MNSKFSAVLLNFTLFIHFYKCICNENLSCIFSNHHLLVIMEDILWWDKSPVTWLTSKILQEKLPGSGDDEHMKVFQCLLNFWDDFFWVKFVIFWPIRVVLHWDRHGFVKGCCLCTDSVFSCAVWIPAKSLKCSTIISLL